MDDAAQRVRFSLALWTLGILVNFILIAAYTFLLSQMPDAKPPNVFTILIVPASVNFLAICIAGLLYELLLKPHDQGHHNTLVHNAVRRALLGGDPSSYVEHSDEGLNRDQLSIKASLLTHTHTLHQQCVQTFAKDNILTVHEFENTWALLLAHTFSTNQELLDFSIGSNAMLSFQAYQFKSYYHDLATRRAHQTASKSKIRIMILCDSIQSESDAAGLAFTSLASRELELAISQLLKDIASVNHLPTTTPPNEIYRLLAYGQNRIFQLRLISQGHIKEGTADLLSKPFNVYGTTAVSRSLVPTLPTDTIGPIPHITVTLNSAEINNYRDAYELIWNAAAEDVEKFAATMKDWSDLGNGKLLDQWSKIGVHRLLLPGATSNTEQKSAVETTGDNA